LLAHLTFSYPRAQEKVSACLHSARTSAELWPRETTKLSGADNADHE